MSAVLATSSTGAKQASTSTATRRTAAVGAVHGSACFLSGCRSSHGHADVCSLGPSVAEPQQQSFYGQYCSSLASSTQISRLARISILAPSRSVRREIPKSWDYQTTSNRPITGSSRQNGMLHRTNCCQTLLHPLESATRRVHYFCMLPSPKQGRGANSRLLTL